MEQVKARKTHAKMEDEYEFEAKHYDKIWGRYDYDTDVKLLDKLFKKHRCRRIIDIGCGTGNHATRLAKLGYEVTATDISPAMLKVFRSKIKGNGINIKQGDMKKLPQVFPKERFDAAILLGHVTYHLNTDKEAKAFFKSVHKILKQKALFIFSARNSKKIDETLLNNLRLRHWVNDEETQIVVLEHNIRDSHDPNTIVWRSIFLVKEKGRADFQIREHRLRWFTFQKLKSLLNENGFNIVSTYSGPLGDKFNEDLHADMWLVTTTL
jgi:ubiquinone/menaquinone biosynthesis C-methylase UbiE